MGIYCVILGMDWVKYSISQVDFDSFESSWLNPTKYGSSWKFHESSRVKFDIFWVESNRKLDPPLYCVISNKENGPET